MSAPPAPQQNPKTFDGDALNILFSNDWDLMTPNEAYHLYKMLKPLQMAVKNIVDDLLQCKQCRKWHYFADGNHLHCSPNYTSDLLLTENSIDIRCGRFQPFKLVLKTSGLKQNAKKLLEHWDCFVTEVTEQRKKCNSVVFDLKKVSEADKKVLLDIEARYQN